MDDLTYQRDKLAAIQRDTNLLEGQAGLLTMIGELTKHIKTLQDEQAELRDAIYDVSKHGHSVKA